MIKFDPLFQEAATLVVAEQRSQTSFLQRKLNLGYNRASIIIDQLYAVGVIGPSQGIVAREVLVKNQSELNKILTPFSYHDEQ